MATSTNPLTLFIPIAETADPLVVMKTIAENQPALNKALTSVGTVHFARFVLLDRSKPNLKFDPQSPGTNTGQFTLAVLTEYDGPFSVYVKAFVSQVGQIFDALLKFSADGTQLVPVESNADAFVDYVSNNDSTYMHPEALYSAYPYSVNQILGGMSGE